MSIKYDNRFVVIVLFHMTELQNKLYHTKDITNRFFLENRLIKNSQIIDTFVALENDGRSFTDKISDLCTRCFHLSDERSGHQDITDRSDFEK